MISKVERIESARMDRLERVSLERHNRVMERLDFIIDRIGKMESVSSLLLAHLTTENKTYILTQRAIDILNKRVGDLERGAG